MPEALYRICRCSEGFELVGNNTVVCNPSGDWPTILPQCVKMCPSSLSEVVQHSIESHQLNYLIGETTTVLCRPGFNASGNMTVSCLASGLWRGYPILPKCIPITCETPANNLIVIGESTVNSTISFKCSSGFTLFGKTTATCLPNGLWDTGFPECVQVDCLDPPAIEHGSTEYTNTFYRSNATYSCEDGYILKGDSNVSCGDNSSWTPTTAYCEPVHCSHIAHIVNGALVNKNNSTNYGSVRHIQCEKGYVLIGSNETVCSASGVWKPEVC